MQSVVNGRSISKSWKLCVFETEFSSPVNIILMKAERIMQGICALCWTELLISLKKCFEVQNYLLKNPFLDIAVMHQLEMEFFSVSLENILIFVSEVHIINEYVHFIDVFWNNSKAGQRSRYTRQCQSYAICVRTNELGLTGINTARFVILYAPWWPSNIWFGNVFSSHLLDLASVGKWRWNHPCNPARRWVPCNLKTTQMR